MKKLFLPVLGVIGMTALASGIAATQEVSLSSLLGLNTDNVPASQVAVSQSVNSSFTGAVNEWAEPVSSRASRLTGNSSPRLTQ